MELTDLSGMEKMELNQQMGETHDTRAQPGEKAPEANLRVDVPCCCPGCFSFDF